MNYTMWIIITMCLVAISIGFGYAIHTPVYITTCTPTICEPCPIYDVVNETIMMIEERDELSKEINIIDALINTDGWRNLR